MFQAHDIRKIMFQSMTFKHEGTMGFRRNQRRNIIGYDTIDSSCFPYNIFFVKRIKHNLLSISKLSDIVYDKVYYKKSCKVTSQKDDSILFN